MGSKMKINGAYVYEGRSLIVLSRPTRSVRMIKYDRSDEIK